MRRAVPVLAVILTLVLPVASPAGAQPSPFRPGAPGLGDPYFPYAGNGGYDVSHYDLAIRYTPATDVLAGTATITARATQHLSAFNLDFDGLTLRALTVDGRPAAWQRADGELTVTPSHGLRKDRTFTVVARYDGVPQPVDDSLPGESGVLPTADGMVIAGEPEVASTWFPANDHPRDKASFTTRITAPQGLESLSNGVRTGRSTRNGWTTTEWHAREPMAPYLATATVGDYRESAYNKAGVSYRDAIDAKLFVPLTPPTGTRVALAEGVGATWQRLTRAVDVPVGGASLSFHVARDTAEFWEFFFVEAHPVGSDAWTTLPDANGHTSTEPGGLCYTTGVHPFLEHYVTTGPDETCVSTGAFHGASGDSDGYEQWTVDLSPYAGQRVEVSLSLLTDEFTEAAGAYVDDVVVSTGPGTTSFEDDGDAWDGWVPGGPPAGSPPAPGAWTIGTAADFPPPTGEYASASLARQPEMIAFLAGVFGPYPFSAAGGIVDVLDTSPFALETQTRPVYAHSIFDGPGRGDPVVVHELAHQWYGDSLALGRWQDIWLNEGFATYAEWMWSAREGRRTEQEIFDQTYREEDPYFWELPIGDPGPSRLFDYQVYLRGAMTLHALRREVGDPAFFRILRTWASSRAGTSVTTPDFVALAERVSGRSLDALFQAWLFTPARPGVAPADVAKSPPHRRPAVMVRR